MNMSSKAVSTLISFVLIVAISLTAISIALIIASNVANRAAEAAVANEAQTNMNILANTIAEVATEAPGSKRTVILTVTNGVYSINSTFSSLYFDYGMKSGILQPRTYSKQGNIEVFTCPINNNINYELRAKNNRVVVTGGPIIMKKGTSSVCVQKAGTSGGMPLVNVSMC